MHLEDGSLPHLVLAHVGFCNFIKEAYGLVMACVNQMELF